jgi:hypothetical protein
MPPLVPDKRKANTSDRKARDYGQRHRRLRKQLLAINPLCQNCGQAFAVEAHHLRYPAESLSDYLAVCKACHKIVDR